MVYCIMFRPASNLLLCVVAMHEMQTKGLCDIIFLALDRLCIDPNGTRIRIGLIFDLR